MMTNVLGIHYARTYVRFETLVEYINFYGEGSDKNIDPFSRCGIKIDGIPLSLIFALVYFLQTNDSTRFGRGFATP